ncbi:hypothetical protein TNCV_4834561 [Trichonephila clavipes]|nr:hypothetical protein TNCV_4834561 [Trichonephila clavipes]
MKRPFSFHHHSMRGYNGPKTSPQVPIRLPSKSPRAIHLIQPTTILVELRYAFLWVGREDIFIPHPEHSCLAQIDDLLKLPGMSQRDEKSEGGSSSLTRKQDGSLVFVMRNIRIVCIKMKRNDGERFDQRKISTPIKF